MDGWGVQIFSPTSISGRISNNSRGSSIRGGISVIISSYPTPKIMLTLIQPRYEYELHKNRHTWTDRMWMIAAKQPFLHLLLLLSMKHSDKKDIYHQGDQIVICPAWTTENTDFTNPLKSSLFKDLRRYGAFARPLPL